MLCLTLLESNCRPLGTKIYIAPSGMIGSIRNAKDATTYLGS